MAAEPQVHVHSSPNRGPRRDGLLPTLVVLHYTAMRSEAAALARLCDPAAEVSAHYLIGRHGRITRLVPEAERAWHAGAGAWGGAGDINSRSIGIEIDNDGASPFAAAAMAALEALLSGVLARWSIRPEAVIGHSDMAPARKADPGPRFDWRRLAVQGLAVWPTADAPAEPAEFLPALRRFGYPEAPPETLLLAFRLHFRPSAKGEPDGWDAALALDLARQAAQG